MKTQLYSSDIGDLDKDWFFWGTESTGQFINKNNFNQIFNE